MPEAIGKGIASYLLALKDTAPLAAKKEPIEPLSRRESASLKSVDITISKKTIDRSREEWLVFNSGVPNDSGLEAIKGN